MLLITNILNPPLEDKVIQDKIKFNEKKELGFKCNEEPMCNHCDKKIMQKLENLVSEASLYFLN